MSVSNVQPLRLICEEDYLAGELSSTIRHEYVAGKVYAMVGARFAHNLIASNILGELHAQLKGKPCRALNSDSKVRIEFAECTSFYYPDVSVVCGSNLLDGTYQDKPTVVFEVVSESTRRIDEGEKRTAYLRIPTLTAYLLLEQDTAAIVVHRRVNGEFQQLTFQGLETVVPLPEIGVQLSLAGAYDNVVFPPPRGAWTDDVPEDSEA